jgi:hypothetical protein
MPTNACENNFRWLKNRLTFFLHTQHMHTYINIHQLWFVQTSTVLVANPGLHKANIAPLEKSSELTKYTNQAIKPSVDSLNIF